MRRELIPRLLERAVEFHARKGIREGCNCSYCDLKRRASNHIGSFRLIGARASSYDNPYPWKVYPWESWDAIQDYYIGLVASYRNSLRAEYRIRLAEEKSKV